MKKSVIYDLISMFIMLLSVVLLHGCSDNDDDEEPDVISSNLVIDSDETNMAALWMVLQNDPDIDMVGGDIEGWPETDTPEKRVYYYGMGTPAEVSQAKFRKEYNRGVTFLVSKKNAPRLAQILGVDVDDLAVMDSDKAETKGTMETSKYIVNDIDDEDADGPALNEPDPVDSTKVVYNPPVDWESALIPTNEEHFYLISKKFHMLALVPKTGFVPEGTANAMKEAVIRWNNTPDTYTYAYTSSGVTPVIQNFTISKQLTYSHRVTNYPVSQTISAYFNVTRVYNATDNADYIQVSGDVTFPNSQLARRKLVVNDYIDNDWDCYVYEGYSTGARLYAQLGRGSSDTDGLNNSKFHLIGHSPQTSTGSTSYSTGTSYTVGGSVSGITPGVMGNITFNDSRTTSIPDVSVYNYCIGGENGSLNDQRWGEWKFDIARPDQHSDYTNTDHKRWAVEDGPAINRTTALYQFSAIWKVDAPQSGWTNRISLCIVGGSGAAGGAQNIWTSQHWIWSWYSMSTGWYSFNLTSPAR